MPGEHPAPKHDEQKLPEQEDSSQEQPTKPTEQQGSDTSKLEHRPGQLLLVCGVCMFSKLLMTVCVLAIIVAMWAPPKFFVQKVDMSDMKLIDKQGNLEMDKFKVELQMALENPNRLMHGNFDFYADVYSIDAESKSPHLSERSEIFLATTYKKSVLFRGGTNTSFNLLFDKKPPLNTTELATRFLRDCRADRSGAQTKIRVKVHKTQVSKFNLQPMEVDGMASCGLPAGALTALSGQVWRTSYKQVLPNGAVNALAGVNPANDAESLNPENDAASHIGDIHGNAHIYKKARDSDKVMRGKLSAD